MNALHDLTPLEADVRTLAAALLARRWMLASAESCTGGLIAAACTAIAGSSDWFDAGFVTYSYAAKEAQLGVPHELLMQHGAVSEEVAHAMVEGALARSQAHVAVAVTGIAGPSGGVPGKPVGTVWFGWGRRDGIVQTECVRFDGDRADVRGQTAQHALRRALQIAA